MRVIRHLLAVAMVLSIAGVAMSEDAPTPSGGQPLLAGPRHAGGDTQDGEREFSGDRRGRNGIDQLDRILDSLDLSDTQRKQIDELVAETMRKNFAFGKVAGRLRQGIAQAQEAGNPKKVAKLEAELRELENDRPKPGDVMRGVIATVNPQQKQMLIKHLLESRSANRAMGRRPIERFEMALALIDLSAEQREKIDPQIAAWREKVRQYQETYDDRHEILELQLSQAQAASDRQRVKEIHIEMRQLKQSRPDPMALFRAISSDLTSAQRQTLQQLREQGAKVRGAQKDGAPSQTQLDL